MSDQAIYVRIKVGYGEHGGGVESELKLDDPEVIQGIIFRAAGRPGGAGWNLAREWLWLAVQNAVLEWAQQVHQSAVQAARNPADILALGLANHERRQRIDREPDEG